VSTNAGPIAERIRDVIEILQAWLDDLDTVDGPDPAAIEARLRDARERLDSMAR
jgi:hypothetical protein